MLFSSTQADTGLLNKVYEQLKSTRKMDKDLTRTDLMVKLSKLNRKEDKAIKTSFLSRQDTSVMTQGAFAAAIDAAQQMAAQQTSVTSEAQKELGGDRSRESIIEEERDEEEVAATLPVASPTPEHKSASSIFGGRNAMVQVEIPAGSTANSDCHETPMSPSPHPRGLARAVSTRNETFCFRKSEQGQESKSARKSMHMHALRNATRKKVIQVKIAIVSVGLLFLVCLCPLYLISSRLRL